jgi:hypothetical protein
MNIRCSIFAFALALPFFSAAFLSVAGEAQRTPAAPAAASAPTAIPALVLFSGVAIGGDGKPVTGEIGMTFLIYKDEQGGEPLWLETQTVASDSAGHYKAQLGAANLNGLPSGLFASGEARWLEVQIAGEKPQPRVLLASVPYALKAADAATLGGLPASAFALAGTIASTSAAAQGVVPNANSTVTTPGGTSGYIPEFTGASTIADSPVFVSGGNVGIGTTTPAQTLDVNGTTVFRNNVYVYHNGTATPSAGVNSLPMIFLTEGYDSSTKAVVAPSFQLKAETAGNNTSAPSATFNLLYSNGSTAAETGFHFNPNGTITFAAGQTFPGGTGSGTITGVAAGTGLTGGGTSGKVTLNVNTAQIASLAGNNTYTGSNVFVPSIYEDTDINIDNTNANSGNISPGLRLGQASGEGMASKRTSGGNQFGVDIYTGYSPRLSVNAAGEVAIGTGATFNGSQLEVQSNSNDAVQGSSTSGNGVYGSSTSTSGIFGATGSTSAGDAAVYASSSSVAAGLVGISASGVGGNFTGGNNVDGYGDGALGIMVTGGSTTVDDDFGGDAGDFYGGGASGDYGYGGSGIQAMGGYGNAVSGVGGAFTGGTSANGKGGEGIYGQAPDNTNNEFIGIAAQFEGDVSIDGTLRADTKEFQIDHPLDPASKYLNHASIESSEMVNIYSGNVTTDELGIATVQLPSWFEALNSDFRYQLTTIGRDAHAWISQKVQNGKFMISTNATHVEVSWQITGVRQDAYAKAHPLVVEETKADGERGFYKHPDLYGQPAEKQIEWGRNPQLMRHLKAMREAQNSRATAARAQAAKLQPTGQTTFAARAAKTASTTP